MNKQQVYSDKLDLESFPVKAPEYFNFANDIIDMWAARDRNKLAMIWTNQQGEERYFTFYEMARLSNQAANLLIQYGVRRGDRVFIMVPRLPEWWIFSLALIRIGAVQTARATRSKAGTARQPKPKARLSLTPLARCNQAPPTPMKTATGPTPTMLFCMAFLKRNLTQSPLKMVKKPLQN